MGKKKTMEVFCNLQKLMEVNVIKDKIIGGSLVFESQTPFPCYYHETPTLNPPMCVFLALNKHYHLEEIIRATQIIEKEFDTKLDTGKGFVTIVNKTYYAIRLRHFGNYELIRKIQEAFIRQGIELITNSKLQGQYTSFIRIIKFMYLNKISKGIYLDATECSHSYIEIPVFLNWEKFEEVTKKVKYNWTGSCFEAAYGSFYYKGKLHACIRICSSKMKSSNLKEIRKLYLKKIS